MGRTQLTYRIRMEQVRLELQKILRNFIDMNRYNGLWEGAKNLSYAGSTFPYPDAGIVATYTMILHLNIKLQKLEGLFETLES